MGRLKDYQHMQGKNNPKYKTGLKQNGRVDEIGIYNSWQNMKSRCLCPSNQKYSRYGGRGIKVCAEWIDIIGFYNWAKSSGWAKGLQIDRIDNDGDYEPSNCRWVTPSDNARRKRTTKLTMEQAGEIRNRLSAGESEQALASEYGVVHGTIWFIKNNFTHVPDMECTKRIKEHSKPCT